MYPSFQCQPTSDRSGQVYTPNIPESYFDNRNAAYFRATRKGDILNEELTYIYTIPIESDCGGLLTNLEYCYKTSISNKDERINTFNFLVLTQDRQQFRIRDRFRIRSTPLQSTCTTILRVFQHSVELACCDRVNITHSRDLWLAPDL